MEKRFDLPKIYDSGGLGLDLAAIGVDFPMAWLYRGPACQLSRYEHRINPKESS